MSKYFDNDADFSSGLGRFIHTLTWPIRRFYIIIPIATLIYVTPIFFDVKPNEVHLWYKEKSIELYDKSMKNEYVKLSVEKVGSWVETAKAWFSSEEKTVKRKTTMPIKGEASNVLVDMPKKKHTQRKAFDKASEVVPVEVSGIESVTYSDNLVNVSDVEILNTESTNLTFGNLSNGVPVSELIDVQRKISSLVYLRTSKEVEGNAKIINANEVEVGGVYIFLYGIYVNPNSVVGKDAAKYLESKQSSMKCQIVAYTSQNVATGICFSGRENLNKKLTEMNLSQNVAL